MAKRTDLDSILIIGAGPIIIGQACEFDYSGAQACKALKEEGYRVILVNSNPATIMTDPESADSIYIEPINWRTIERIIEKERPSALLPTMGGQTALNTALDLVREGVLEKFNVEMIGASQRAIDMAEDRELFRRAMADIGLECARSRIAHSMEEALAVQSEIGFPTVIRPSFTLGGSGGGIAYNREEFEAIVARGLDASPTNEVLLEESVLGWKEYEMEVVRDRNDNCIIVCSIENIDPMGVHTGDSVTVAPQQTLTDSLYQQLRDQAIAVIRAVGVETGGSNVQFAVNPEDGRVLVIEMNPRVSRSSALASKATGFPIAKIAAKLAVGYTLDELKNEITGGATPASFEPSIDYVVTKIPRFTFEKFPGANTRLTTQMKSVGEAMAIGRTFQQAFAKALRSRELDKTPALAGVPDERLLESLLTPAADRYETVLELLRRGASIESVHERTHIDPWFLSELRALALDPDAPFAGERSFRSVDTCAAEFPARTPYYYSGWERTRASEVRRGERESVVILGSGPNRIGQGIEFDYCCVHAAMTVRASGRDAVMINCNPETVSTDYDTSDRLYFEPLTLEDVLGVVEVEQPEGVIVQFGGQTPLKLAAGLHAAGVPLLGTSVEAIDLAEDRSRFGELLGRLGYQAPPYATASSVEEALQRGEEVGYPLLVRPSYVLGGRAMEIVYSREGLADYLRREVGEDTGKIFLDRFLENAIELDVDALCDGKETWIGGIMQHVEEAGVHSGDSACVLPPHSLGGEMLDQIRAATRELALQIGVVGLLNVQYAVVDGQLYVIEANPRASRTVPFVSKAVGLPLAKLACRVMLGEPISALHLPREREGLGFGDHVSVKEAVLPFDRFEGSDAVLGPEMRSTGEVMGIARDFPTAFAKAQAAAGCPLPLHGTVFISVTDADKAGAFAIAERLHENGFRILATRGTAEAIARMGIPAQALNKVSEGSPHVLDWIERGDVDLVVNTPTGSGARTDGWQIRRAAVTRGVPCLTTLAAGVSAARAISSARRSGAPPVLCLQELHRGRETSGAGVA